MEASLLSKTVILVGRKCRKLCPIGVDRCSPLRFSQPSLEIIRGVHTQNINKNIRYISNDKIKFKIEPKTLKLDQNIKKPLCVIMNWMLAKPKHVLKYANIYLEQDYDVVNVSCSPLQLMWPAKGSQVIAAGLMSFLESNKDFGHIVVHGFSVGAYVWAELLVQAVENEKRYQPVLDRISAQIWDSPADIHEIPVGLPFAVFPNNKFLQEILRAYTKSHMKVFHKVATKHYLRATDVYHKTPCRAPGLFLCSLTDPVGAAKRSRHAHDMWKKNGIKCNWKCWEKSPHVQHYLHHPEEYLAALYNHLEECGLLQRTDKMRIRVL